MIFLSWRWLQTHKSIDIVLALSNSQWESIVINVNNYETIIVDIFNSIYNQVDEVSSVSFWLSNETNFAFTRTCIADWASSDKPDTNNP